VASSSVHRPAERIVVADADPLIRSTVTDSLAQHGYLLETASDAQQLEGLLARLAIDLVVLDMSLPGGNGLALCRKLARPDGPGIIILSVLSEAIDRIVGLELGADDYLAKPFNPRELLARVRAVLRRRRRAGDMSVAYEFAGWRLDPARHELRSPNGEVAELPSRQFALLRALVERPQRILTRDELLEYACGPNADVFDRAVDVGISRLRRKLRGSGVELIRTVRQSGYMFLPKVTRSRSTRL